MHSKFIDNEEDDDDVGDDVQAMRLVMQAATENEADRERARKREKGRW